MIGALVATLLTGAAVGPTNLAQLDACLVNLSVAPEFSNKSLENLAADKEGFLAKARDSWCSSEVADANMWSEAHDAARLKLGVPAEGLPANGQQELAEASVLSMLAERIQGLGNPRSDPPALTPEKLSELQLIWLLDQSEDETVAAIIEPPIKCIALAASKDEVAANKIVSEYGPASARIGKLGQSCLYDAALSTLAERLQGRFPNTSLSDAKNTTDNFMGQLLFWAMLATDQSE